MYEWGPFVDDKQKGGGQRDGFLGPKATPSNSKRKLKFEKAKRGRCMCVLGRDVTMDSVVALSQRALVGKFKYIHPSREEILEWIIVSWNLFIVKLPRVLILVNGWLIAW